MGCLPSPQVRAGGTGAGGYLSPQVWAGVVRMQGIGSAHRCGPGGRAAGGAGYRPSRFTTPKHGQFCLSMRVRGRFESMCVYVYVCVGGGFEVVLCVLTVYYMQTRC